MFPYVQRTPRQRWSRQYHDDVDGEEEGGSSRHVRNERAAHAPPQQRAPKQHQQQQQQQRPQPKRGKRGSGFLRSPAAGIQRFYARVLGTEPTAAARDAPLAEIPDGGRFYDASYYYEAWFSFAVAESKAAIAAASSSKGGRTGPLRLQLELTSMEHVGGAGPQGLVKSTFVLRTGVAPGPSRRALQAGSIFRLAFDNGGEYSNTGNSSRSSYRSFDGGGAGRGGGGGGGTRSAKRARTTPGNGYGDDASNSSSNCLGAVGGEWSANVGQRGSNVTLWMPATSEVQALLGTVPQTPRGSTWSSHSGGGGGGGSGGGGSGGGGSSNRSGPIFYATQASDNSINALPPPKPLRCP